MLTNIRNKKAFTIIELIVVIAIIGILVLFGLPRLLGYVEKAHLAKIQHDVKVMETIMEDEIIQNERRNLNNFNTNDKKLGALILQSKLFGKEGYAKSIEYVPPEADFLLGLEEGEEIINLVFDNNEEKDLGMGGPGVVNEISHEDIEDPSFSYKIIPEEYKKKAKSSLKGTFYTNDNGKVYYEPDKPLTRKPAGGPACTAPEPLPDYDFEHLTGKIVKYNGDAEHLVIPPYFLVNGECWPVKIIGKGAFMQGPFKSIVIPYTVEIIEEFAFLDSHLEKFYIPGSVREIYENAFGGNNLKEIIYGGHSNQVIYHGRGGGIYIQRGGGSVSVEYVTPTPGQAGVIYIPTIGGGGTILRGESGYIPPYVKVNGTDRPVTVLATGSYQGLGLKSVVLPETLEIIEDYAFAGNQLMGIRIPNSVKEIGNYAFAFNEVSKVGNIPGPDIIATIKTIVLKDEEQFDKVNKYGDILDGGTKIDVFSKPGQEGSDIVLKNHIWVTNIGNIVINEEYVENETKHIRHIKLLEKANSAYFNKNSKYPTTSDISYTVHEVKGFGESLVNNKDEVVEFGYGQSYYDFDYSVLKSISIPENERTNYLIDDTGKAYYLSNITDKGLTREPGKIELGGIDIEGEIIYVNGDVNDLTEALEKAKEGDLIYLPAGEYYINDMMAIFRKKNVNIIGEGINTIINVNRMITIPTGYVDNKLFRLVLQPSSTFPKNNSIVKGGGYKITFNLEFHNVLFRDPYSRLYKNNRHNTYIIGDDTSNITHNYNNLKFINSLSLGSPIISTWNDSSSPKIQIINSVTNYKSLTTPNNESSHANNISVTTSLVNSTFDSNYNIISPSWQNAGTGFNKDGTKAHIGLYGGPFAWD